MPTSDLQEEGLSSNGDEPSEAGSWNYYVYVLRCGDGSLYAGITTDIARRLREHRSGGSVAARYTRTHGVEALVALWHAPNRSEASKLEWRLHHMRREEKLALVADPRRVESPFEPAASSELLAAWNSSEPARVGESH